MTRITDVCTAAFYPGYGPSPPSCRPRYAFLRSWHNEVMPAIGKCREQQYPEANRCNEKTPRHVVNNHHQRIDSGWWVKRACQVHCDHRNPNRHGRGPWRWSAQLDGEEADERRQKVTANQRARLRRPGVRRAQHNDDRGRKRNGCQRVGGGGAQRFHAADGNGAPCRAGDNRRQSNPVKHPVHTTPGELMRKAVTEWQHGGASLNRAARYLPNFLETSYCGCKIIEMWLSMPLPPTVFVGRSSLRSKRNRFFARDIFGGLWGEVQ
jgi:hypothetical protein